MKRSWVEISLERLAGNAKAVRRVIGEGTDIIAVVKANAYGHGGPKVASHLHGCGVTSFAVATLEEALNIREVINNAKILVLQGCDAGQERLFIDNRLTASVFEGGRVPDVEIELKVDSGMGRLGVSPAQAPALLHELGERVTGVFSHFASSESDAEFTRAQLDTFLAATKDVTCRRHIANSGALCFRAAHLDAVRPGLALYGISPCPGLFDVRPVLAWKVRILSLKKMSPGETVGYGRTFTVARPSLIAVLPIGYADGFSRAFSNNGQVRIRGVLAPVVGRVSMDLLSVDVTDVPDVAHGDEVTLLEGDPQSPLSAARLANRIGTIPYEILTSIGSRVERVYV
ncbi:MAG: alanine racemase [Acidobacteria bacterium]|nr:MAG: alanine racemase [Acidobacteriota bacterium]